VLLFAQIAGAGPAILISCSLALMGIVGFFFVSYFAHCFLTVVIDSAAGVDEIRWPSESITDWLTKPIYVLWVLLPLLFVPSMVVAFGGGTAGFLITLVVLLWLVSPILFLSSLAAKSWMALLYGPFLKRWARFFFAYLIFLVWSAVLVGSGTALLVASMWSLKGVAVATVALPALFLLYSRVLGRYAWYVTTRRMRRPKKHSVPPVKGVKVQALDPWAPPPPETTEAPREVRRPEAETFDSPDDQADLRDKFAPADSYRLAPVEERAKVMSPDVESPEDAPKLQPLTEPAVAEAEDEWTPNKKPYDVMTERQARESWVERHGDAGADAEGYGMESITLGPPVSLWHYYEERAKQEEKLREEGKAVRQYERPRKPPTLWQAMTQEIGKFLFYSHSLRAWINLAIFFGIELAVLNVIVHMTGLINSQ
jgi:signal transduction histidine kinase